MGYFEDYGVLLAVVLAGAALVAVAYLLAKAMSPSNPFAGKLINYECGIDPVGRGWAHTQVRYYIYAFLFVIFDVESVYLFPWARVFEALGMQAVIEMAVFILILAAGLLYAWRKGVLRWV